MKKHIFLLVITGLLLVSCENKVESPQTKPVQKCIVPLPPFQKHIYEQEMVKQRIADYINSHKNQLNKMGDTIELCGYFYSVLADAQAGQDKIDSVAYVWYPEDIAPPTHYFDIITFHDKIENKTWYFMYYDEVSVSAPGMEIAECKSVDIY